MIKFNKVTWYSQIAAIVLGVMIFLLGMYVGGQLEKNRVDAVESSVE